MKKKHVLVWVALICLMVACVGCAGKKEKGDKRFTYSWYAYSMKSTGDTMYLAKNEPFAPEFSSPDGVTCTFTNNQKAHNGTIEKIDDNQYNLVFPDSKASMVASFSDDTMTIDVNNGKIVIVFKRAD